jgi:hypothetical protein
MLGAALAGGLVGGGLSLLSPAVGAPVGGATFIVGLMVAMMAPTAVQVGVDGVLVRWLTYERFIPHGEIRTAEVHVRGWGRSRRLLVELGLESGEIYKIPITLFHWHRDKAKLLAQRILEAKAAHDSGAEVEDSALLLRRGRDVQQWLDSLRTVTERATHRSAPMKRDRLWRFVEDPSCDPTTRAAAAVALGAGLSGPERKRIQAVAQASAAPRLRIALDAVAANEDDGALAEALAEIEDEHPVGEQRR